jgi:rhamnosyltransferase
MQEYPVTTVSIIIPSLNAERTIGRVLEGIRSQRFPQDRIEVIVIDSSSRDATREIAEGYGVRVITIPQEEFHHGGTRNMGARLAAGEHLVFLTDHAVPANEDWLGNLVAGLEGEGVAGCYGRQTAHPGTVPMEAFYLEYMYGPEPRSQRWNGGRLNITLTWFSNVNGAMKKEVWERFPFSESIVMSEDQEWTRRVLEAGYAIAYRPDAVVYHSHNYSMKHAFRRFFDSGMSSHDSFLPESGGGMAFLLQSGLRYLGAEIRFLSAHGQFRWIPYALVYEFNKFLAVSLGRRHGILPSGLKRRLSYHLSVAPSP